RFAGMPDIVASLVKRINLDVSRLDEIIRFTEQSFTYPVLVRTVTEQRSQGIALAHDREALRGTLLSFRQHPQLYLMQYVGARRHNGCYRKMRAVVVDGQPAITWADYHAEWIVQSRAVKHIQGFYRANPEALADANDIVARPHERLGAAAMATLD